MHRLSTFIARILLLIACCCQSHAQQTAYQSKWTHFSKKIDSLYQAGKYAAVIEAYNREVRPADLDLYLNYVTLGFAYFKTGNTEQAVQTLKHCVVNQEFSGIANLRYQLSEQGITDTLPVWKPLFTAYESLAHAGDAFHNAYAISVWDSMRHDDLAIRNLINTERDSVRIRELYSEMERVDDLNFQRLKRLSDTLGHFPGFRDIGRQRTRNTTWLLIHFLSDDQFAYTTKGMRAAYLQGQQYGITIPFITDRRQFLLDKPNIYGLNNKWDGDTLILREIEDIEYIDERRAAWGLIPLCEDLKETKYIYKYGELNCK